MLSSSFFFFFTDRTSLKWCDTVRRCRLSRFILSLYFFFFLAFFFHLINKDLTRMHAAAGAPSRSDRHGDPATACWLFFAFFSVSGHSRTLNALIPTVASLQCDARTPFVLVFVSLLDSLNDAPVKTEKKKEDSTWQHLSLYRFHNTANNPLFVISSPGTAISISHSRKITMYLLNVYTIYWKLGL